MQIVIEYCRVWNYGARAVRVADEILLHYEHVIESLALVPSSGGRFEVTVDGALIFSRLKSGRHAQPGELVEQLRPLAAAAEQAARLGY